MPHDPVNITDAELAVLEAIWSQGPATIRHITDILYPAGSASHYATVQKLLDRLEGKSCVSRDRSGFAHIFSAVVDRDEVIAERLQVVANQLCEGSLTPLLLQLASATKLTPAERAELLKLIDESGPTTSNRT